MGTSAGQRILNIFHRFSGLPGGHFVFSWILANQIPYSATIGARIIALEPGYAKLMLRDRRSIRNHLNSIHAVALTNLGELTSGLALNTGLSMTVRGIATHISSDYFKKARGNLISTCRCQIPVITQDMDYCVTSDIYDAQQEIVARIATVWRLALK